MVSATVPASTRPAAAAIATLRFIGPIEAPAGRAGKARYGRRCATRAPSGVRLRRGGKLPPSPSFDSTESQHGLLDFRFTRVRVRDLRTDGRETRPPQDAERSEVVARGSRVQRP